MAVDVSIDFGPAMRDLKGWETTVGPVVEAETQRFAEQLRSQVQGKVPTLTGTLARTVTVVDEPGEVGFGIGMGSGDPTQLYAGYIEFGGRHGRELVSQGRYIYPTVIETEPQFRNAVEDAVTVSIDRYAWSKSA